VPLHYYALMDSTKNNFGSFSTKYQAEYGDISKTGNDLLEATMCGALSAGIAIRGEVYNHVANNFEKELLYFKMKCEFKNLGNN